MRRPICTLLCLLCCTLAFAQINTYVPGTWESEPHPYSKPEGKDPFTVLKYIAVRDFTNVSPDVLHHRTIYKRIRINNQKGADSLNQVLFPLDANEHSRYVNARIIFPDGHIAEVPSARIYMRGIVETVRLAPLKLVPGCELEYDIYTEVADTWAGIEYLQSTTPCDAVTFMLVLPPNVLFRSRGYNGFPDLLDSISTLGTHYFHSTAYHVPAMVPGDLYYYTTWLQRIEFSKRETNWQEMVRDKYLKYAFLYEPEYKSLQKEVRKWDFLKTRMPLPTLIYQIEQKVKSEYKIAYDKPEDPDLSDIPTMITTKSCNETGIVKLMASIYYLLGIRSQLMFTPGRESVPLDSTIINLQVADNVLIYFPDLNQALAPSAMNTRFPYFPASWAGMLALRCRDTVVNNNADVLTDFLHTPAISDYTNNNISMEATLNINALGVNDVTIKQTLGGYPAMAIKSIIANTPDAQLEEEYNSMLPTGPIKVSNLDHIAENRNWDKPIATAPFVLTSTFKTDSIGVGTLINGLVQQYVVMPPPEIPIEMAFPFYQESRIYITVPAGYKLANAADFKVDIPGTSLGYKITCKQEDNKITIYALKWFKKTSYNTEDKKIFEKIIREDNVIKNKRLLLSKS